MPRHLYTARRCGRTWAGEVVTVNDGAAGELLTTTPTTRRADAIARALASVSFRDAIGARPFAA